jgi:nitrogen fixation NifU-like protein
MTERLKGRTEAEARALFDDVHALLTNGADEAALAALGKLAALGGVRAYPTRVKCASLCWHTLKAALDDVATVSTE